MMKKITLIISILALTYARSFSQVADEVYTDSLEGFQVDVALQHSGESHEPYEAETQIRIAKRDYIDQKYHLGRYSADYHYPGKVTNNPVFPVASCSNADFEAGDFTGWAGEIGDNMTSCFAPFTNPQLGIFSTIQNAPLSDANARHTMITPAYGNDYYGGFPGVPPGSGNYTIRLGGETPLYHGEKLEQTFTVSPLSTSFAYRYAVVFNEPLSGTHLSTSKPYFRIEVLDQNGAPISNCTQYFDTSSTSNPLFLLSPYVDPNQGHPVYYKPWTTLNFDLSGYVGQDITIRFTVAGCTQSGHFGYAYIDCSCSNLAANVNFCPGNTFLYLSAPAGYGSYQWLDPNHVPIVGATNDTLFVNNPTVGDTFFVYLESAIDTSCHNILPVVLQYTHIFPNAASTDATCYGYTDGTLAASGTMGFPPYTYTWNTTPVSTSATVSNVPAGTYVVTMVDSLGCTDSDTTVIFEPARLDTSLFTYSYCVGDPDVTVFAPQNFINYTWMYANGDTIQNGPSNMIFITGPQAGVEIDCILWPAVGCPIYDSIILNLNPPSNYFYMDSTVNVFTPNGDLRNDYFYPFYDFSVSNQTGVAGTPQYNFRDLYVDSYEIWIYDRWGNEVFYSNVYDIGWNGRAHDKDCTAGVYYWITKTTSRCKPGELPVENHGFVHLIRD